MTTKDTGGPAYPVECSWAGDEPHGIQTGNASGWATGVTVRDYFAAHAPNEVVSLDGYSVKGCAEKLGLPEGIMYDWKKHYFPLLAKLSYEYADAMLAERSKP